VLNFENEEDGRCLLTLKNPRHTATATGSNQSLVTLRFISKADGILSEVVHFIRAK
jgi:hypothetical protein